MEVTPSLAEIRQIAESGKYRVAPLSCEILADVCTPIQALQILKAQSDHCFILESVVDKESWGRYTFLGFEPKQEISCTNSTLTIDGQSSRVEHPAAKLREIIQQWASPKIDDLPPFTGGLVGYFGFDYLSYAEPTLREQNPTSQTSSEQNQADTWCDLDVMLFDKVIAFDNYRQKIVLIVNISLDDLAANYQAGVAELERLRNLLISGEPAPIEPGKMTTEMVPHRGREQYCQMVERAKNHIVEGDIFQIVLSNQFSADFEGSLINTYRVLRTTNPSPYMFYLTSSSLEIAGASPETLVKLQDDKLQTFPLAGTRPRGKTEAEDLALEAELLADEKELAEHNMLVDLGRNDLGKISKFGSVKVEKLHSIERYSHVMHIGSTVSGQIRQEYDALDAIGAVLPAGTLSGAPKIRACQLIHELEQAPRGIYGGAIGYLDLTGNMDVCIAIRFAYRKGEKVYVRSGAGIVADSNPDKEFDECVNKAKAVVEALKLAERI